MLRRHLLGLSRCILLLLLLRILLLLLLCILLLLLCILLLCILLLLLSCILLLMCIFIAGLAGARTCWPLESATASFWPGSTPSGIATVTCGKASNLF
jgi:hypothetical protein